MKKIMFVLMFAAFLAGIKNAHSQTDTLFTNFITPLESFETGWVSATEGALEAPKFWLVKPNRTLNPDFGIFTWARSVNDGFQQVAHSGTGYATIGYTWGTVLDDWLISPQYQLPTDDSIVLNFFATAMDDFGSNSGTAPLEILISTTGREFADFTYIYGEQQIRITNQFGDYDSISISLAALKGKKIYIAFRAKLAPGLAQRLFLDDISLFAPRYTSPRPTITDIGFTSAIARWDKKESTSYQISYSTSPKSDPMNGDSVSITTADNFIMDPLTDSKVYYVYLRALGQNGIKGQWEGPVTFTTACNTIVSRNTLETGIFYRGNFDNLTCWGLVDKKGSSQWHVDSSATPYFLYFYAEGDTVGIDDWIVSPEIKIPTNQMFKFHYSAPDVRTQEYFSVWFVQDTNQLFSGAIELLPARNYPFTTGRDIITVDLSSLGGRTGRLAIRNESKQYSSQLEIHSFTIEDSYPCMPIQNLQIQNRTDTSALISWGSNNSSFKIQCSANGNFNPDIETGIISKTVTGSEYTLSGLTAGIEYFVFVRTDCDETNKSSWVRSSFRTLARVTQFPYSENFQTWNTTSVPGLTADWNVIDRNGDNNSFRGVDDPQFPSNVGAGVLNNTGGRFQENRDQWLVSPKFALPSDKTMVCSFELKTNLKQDIEKVSIMVSTAGMLPADFSTLTPAIEISSERILRPLFFNLDAYKGQEIYIAIRLESKLTSNTLFIDNFRIEESPIAPPHSIQIDSSNYNSIGLSWQGSAPNYRIAYQRYFFNPNNLDESIYMPLTNKKNQLVEHLSPGTNYFFFIQSVNGPNQTSSWIGPIYVNTNCEEVRTPFIETFDGWLGYSAIGKATYPMGCWNYVYSKNPITEAPANFPFILEGINNGFSPWETGLGFATSSINSQVDTFDRYLISPQIRMPLTGAILSYWVSAGNENEKVYYDILLSTSGKSLGDFTYLIHSDSVSKEPGRTRDWENKLVQIRDKSNNAFPDSLVYIAFRIKGKGPDGFVNELRLDDFIMESLVVSCSYPDSIQFSEGVGSEMIAKWKSTAPKFEIMYSNRLINPYSNPFSGTRDTVLGDGTKAQASLRNLQPGIATYFWVRGICSNGQTTLWRGPFTVTGSCNGYIYEFPYENNFNRLVLAESPSAETCWKSITINQSGFVGNRTGVRENYSTTMAAYSSYRVRRGSMDPNSVESDELPAGDSIRSVLVSPKIHVESNQDLFLTFKYQFTSSVIDEQFYVLVSKTNSNLASFTDTLAIVRSRNTPELFLPFTGDLSQYKGEDIYIAILYATKNNTLFAKSIGLSIDNFSVQKNECPMAREIQIGSYNAVDQTVSATWQGTTTEGWMIQYHNQLFDPYSSDSPGVILLEDENTHSFSLAQGEQRVFYIAPANCTGAIAWVGPFTAFACQDFISNFPYLEGFEGWNNNLQATSCWRLLDEDQDGFNFSTTTEEISSSFVAQVNANRADGLAFKWNNWLISPSFDLSAVETPLVEFRGLAGPNLMEKLKFYVSTIPFPNDTLDFVLIDSMTLTNPNWDGYGFEWRRFQKVLADYGNQGQITFAIRHDSDSSSETNLSIDNFLVMDIGDCTPVEDVSATNVSSHSLSLTWRTTNAAESYKVMYSTIPFNYAETWSYTTVYTSNSIGNNIFQLDLTGLTEGTEIYYYLSPQCSAIEQENPIFGPYMTKTDCGAINSYPYLQNFDNFLILQNRNFGCWNTLDANQDQIAFRGHHTTTGASRMAFFYFPSFAKTDTIDDWVISAPIVLPPSPILGFSFLTGSTKEQFDLLIAKKSEAKLDNGSFDLSKFQTLKSFHISQPRDTVLEYNSSSLADLLSYIDEEVYIGFHLYSAANQTMGNSFQLDSVVISSSNYCYLTPMISGITRTTTTAEVRWQGDNSLWNLKYWIDGSTDTVVKNDIAAKVTTLTGLMPNFTKYGVQIQAAGCANNGGNWSAISIFETLPTCPQLTNAIITPGIDTAHISWVSSATPELGYELIWSMKGSATRDTSFITSRDTILRNLTQDTGYIINIRKICTVGDTSRSIERSFFTYYVCPTPYDLTQTAGKYTADLSWSSQRDSIFYISYRKVSEQTWTLDSTRENAFVLRGLTPSTSYEWNVTAECQRGNLSNSANSFFTTLDYSQYQVILLSNNVDYGEVRGDGTFTELTKVTIDAIPNTNYEFLYWEDTLGRKISTQSQYEFTLVSDTILRAVFDKICPLPYNLTILSARVDSTLLTWNGEAAAYRVYYKAVDNSTWDSVDVEENKVALSNMADLTTYEWKVRSLCGALVSASVAGPNFITYHIKDVMENRIALRMSPNPTPRNSKVKIELEGTKKEADIQLIDMMGRVVKRQSIKAAESTILDLNGITPGIYLVRIQGAGWEKTERLVID